MAECHELEKFLKAVEQFDLHTTKIYLANPLDLLKMDMKQFTLDCYFISVSVVKQGQVLLVKDGVLKEELYEFVKNNPDRVFRGEKGLILQ